MLSARKINEENRTKRLRRIARSFGYRDAGWGIAQCEHCPAKIVEFVVYDACGVQRGESYRCDRLRFFKQFREVNSFCGYDELNHCVCSECIKKSRAVLKRDPNVSPSTR